MLSNNIESIALRHSVSSTQFEPTIRRGGLTAECSTIELLRSAGRTAQRNGNDYIGEGWIRQEWIKDRKAYISVFCNPFCKFARNSTAASLGSRDPVLWDPGCLPGEGTIRDPPKSERIPATRAKQFERPCFESL